MRRWLLALGLTVGALASAQTAPATPPTTPALTIRFLDVGQGDAVLITAPTGETLLYDGGRSEARMRELIRQYGVTQVGAVVASHGDADHITGLIPVVALFKPRFFINNGIAATTQTWGRLVSVLSLAGTQGVVAGRDGKTQLINLGEVKLTVLPPPSGMPAGEQNLNSVGLVIEYAGFRSLLTGDSEAQQTNAWLRQYGGAGFGPVDVYKSIHHGAANGDTRSWLSAVRPRNVVVSVGPNNYGHPTASALALYQEAGAAIWRTDQQGTITVTVQPDGRYQVSSERGPSTGVIQPARGAALAPVPAPGPAATPAAPAPAPRVTPQPAPPAAVYYANCAAVRAAGKAPLRRGQPGYRSGLDRDGDGVACE